MYGVVERDSPIDLRCMARYMVDDVTIWDIIGELVLLTTEPPPANPFDVDHTYIDNLPSKAQVQLYFYLLELNVHTLLKTKIMPYLAF